MSIVSNGRGGVKVKAVECTMAGKCRLGVDVYVELQRKATTRRKGRGSYYRKSSPTRVIMLDQGNGTSVVQGVKRQGWGESCSVRLWEREAYILNGARTSPKGEVRESKHAVEPGANSTGPCGRPHGRHKVCTYMRVLWRYPDFEPENSMNWRAILVINSVNTLYDAIQVEPMSFGHCG